MSFGGYVRAELSVRVRVCVRTYVYVGEWEGGIELWLGCEDRERECA